MNDPLTIPPDLVTTWAARPGLLRWLKPTDPHGRLCIDLATYPPPQCWDVARALNAQYDARRAAEGPKQLTLFEEVSHGH